MDWFGSISLHLSDLLYHFWTCPYHIKEATIRIEFLASTSSVCTPIAELVKAHSHSPLVYLFWVTPLASSDAWFWPDLQPPSPPAAFCSKDFGVCKEFSSCICSVSSRMLRTPQNKTHTPCPQHRRSDQLTDIYYRLSKTAVLSVFSAHHRLEGCQEKVQTQNRTSLIFSQEHCGVGSLSLTQFSPLEQLGILAKPNQNKNKPANQTDQNQDFPTNDSKLFRS